MCPTKQICISKMGQCRCHNCMQLAENIECSICTESFITHGISSCHMCGNLVCYACASKLLTCPFCRVAILWQRNVAIENLFKKLKLPCTFNGRGCKKILTDGAREEHQLKCDYSNLVCPLEPICQWEGDLNEMCCHLRQAHSLVLLTGDRVTIEIPSLNTKIKQTEQQLSKYVIILRCHSRFFFCKIILHNRVLKIVFLEVASHETTVYGAWLQVFTKNKLMRSIMEISKGFNGKKELDIACDSLISPFTSGFASDNKLKISINIRPLNVW